MQPTASQLAKVKALVIQKAPKKPAAVPTKPSSSRPNPTTASTNVLNKSSKANIGQGSKTAKPSSKASAPIVAEAVPLPPSPGVEANAPLPEVVEAVAVAVEEKEAPKEEDPRPAGEEKAEEEEEVVAEPEAEEEEESPAPEPAPIGLVVTGSEPFDLPNTPLNPEIKSLGWNIQNAKTPISQLLTSIQQGFEYSPTSPLSPPQSYLTGSNGETQPLSFPLF
jgi:hypothetical protein